jgi:hypothetical protein
MKMNRSTLAALLLASTVPAAFGLTVPVQEDSFSAASGNLSTANGKAAALSVSSTQTAFVKFNFNDPAAVPGGINSGNIVSANLRIYVGKAKTPGTFTVHEVTSAWSEGAAGPAPSFNSTPLATVTPELQTTKDFVIVDITESVRTFPVNGYALVSTGGKVTIPSKEGTLPACELNIETNYANDGNGNFSATTINTDGANASSFLNTGFDPFNNTTLVGGLVGKNGSGPQFRFTEDAGSPFNDIGQDGSGNFVIENGSDVPILTGTQNGNFQLGNFDGDVDRYLTITTTGGNAFRAGLKLRHFDNNFGWTIESDERGASYGLNFLSHFSNADGVSSMFITLDGNVGVGTITPGAKLDVRGDIKLGSTGQFSAVGGSEPLRILRGIVGGADNTPIVRTGFTCQRGATGVYGITFTPSFVNQPTVTATCAGPFYATITNLEENVVQITTRNTAGAVADCVFNVLIVGDR